MVHIQKAHGEVVSEELFGDLASICRVYTAPSLDRCPICSTYEVDWENERRQLRKAKHETTRARIRYPKWEETSFLDHLAQCMHTFALRSLPISARTQDHTEHASSQASRDFSQDSIISSESLNFSTYSGRSGKGLTKGDLLLATRRHEPECGELNARQPPHGASVTG
jgi:hypothetical protein